MGDVHGRLDLLLNLEAQIAADMATFPGPAHCHVVMLGDYVDRGAESRGVIEHLTTQTAHHFERTLLIGNHDWWLRRFLDDDGPALPWLASGGEAVLRSYGVLGQFPANDPVAVETLRRQLTRRVPVAHRRFLHRLLLHHRIGDYLFVHAGIRPGLALEQQDPHDLMFIREPFLSDRRDHGFVVVHGHTVVETPEVRTNRIGIDTGAYWTGVLTALVIDGDGIRFLSTAG